MSEKYELFRKFACNTYRERGCRGKGLLMKMTGEHLQRIKGLYLHGYKNLEGKRLLIKGSKLEFQ